MKRIKENNTIYIAVIVAASLGVLYIFDIGFDLWTVIVAAASLIGLSLLWGWHSAKMDSKRQDMWKVIYIVAAIIFVVLPIFNMLF